MEDGEIIEETSLVNNLLGKIVKHVVKQLQNAEAIIYLGSFDASGWHNSMKSFVILSRYVTESLRQSAT